jgi:hypothetical protein
VNETLPPLGKEVSTPIQVKKFLPHNLKFGANGKRSLIGIFEKIGGGWGVENE